MNDATSPEVGTAAKRGFDDEVDVFISEGNPAPATALYLMNFYERNGLLINVPDDVSIAIRIGKKTARNWLRPSCAGGAVFGLKRSNAKWSLTSVSGLIRRAPKSLETIIDQLFASGPFLAQSRATAFDLVQAASVEDVLATFDMLPVNSTLSLLSLQSAFARMHASIDKADFAKAAVDYFVTRSLAEKGGINAVRPAVIDQALTHVGFETKKTFLSFLKLNLNCDFVRHVLDRGDLDFFLAANKAGIVTRPDIERRIPSYLRERPPEFIDVLVDQGVGFPEEWEEILEQRISSLPAHKAKIIADNTIPAIRSTSSFRAETSASLLEHGSPA